MRAPALRRQRQYEFIDAAGYHDLRMAACPMHLIAAVTIEPIRHENGTADCRITVVVDCGCTYEVSLPLHKRAPRRGEPSHCRGNCKA